VFCLRREQWDRCISVQIDHFLPAAANPEATLDYDNLLYACSRCNSAKGSQSIPDPAVTMVKGAVSVAADGQIVAWTPDAKELIRKLRLDSAELTHFRRIWLEVIALAQKYDADLFQKLLGFPADLPNLSALRPPLGNSRPEGIGQSHHARRQRGELPPTY
jgi:hypothetical protein